MFLDPDDYYPDNDILDKKGRLSQRLFDDGTKADYYYRGNSTTPLFAYYSDGHFESELGIVDKKNGTISLPYRDGIIEVLDKNGALVSYIFPDGTAITVSCPFKRTIQSYSLLASQAHFALFC